MKHKVLIQHMMIRNIHSKICDHGYCNCYYWARIIVEADLHFLQSKAAELIKEIENIVKKYE